MFELTQDVAVGAVETNKEKAFAELAELQLAMASGGCGDVLWG